MRLEDRLSLLESEREITQLMFRYCALVDHGSPELISTEIFAEGAVADYHFHICKGRSEIHDLFVAGMAPFKDSVHAVTNVMVGSCDGMVAEATSVLVALHWYKREGKDADEAPADFGIVTHSKDRLARTSQGWRVTERCTRALGPTFILREGDLVLQRK